MKAAPGLLTEIIRIARPDPDAQRAAAAAISEVSYARGDAMVKEGSICRHLYFLRQGLVKLCFTTPEGKEIILRFFAEGLLFTSLESFLTAAPSRLTLVALEPVAAEAITKGSLELLCARHHSMETFYRHVLSLATVNLLGRISELMQDDATTRYRKFVDGHPDLMQRIALGELAAYLGITPVSLSRIRAVR